MNDRRVTAAVMVIGDEILSGRTRDSNSDYIAHFLAQIGVETREIRVVPDVEDEIVAALNALRARYDYVFTTGGIGPTHDDITADAWRRLSGSRFRKTRAPSRCCWSGSSPRTSTKRAAAWRAFRMAPNWSPIRSPRRPASGSAM